MNILYVNKKLLGLLCAAVSLQASSGAAQNSSDKGTTETTSELRLSALTEPEMLGTPVVISEVQAPKEKVNAASVDSFVPPLLLPTAISEVTNSFPLVMLPTPAAVEAAPQVTKENSLLGSAQTPQSLPSDTNAITSENKDGNTKNILGEDTGKSPLANAMLVVTLLLAFIGTLGYVVVKLKNKKVFTQNRADKPMQIISALSIGPKRQIVLLKIRNQEIVISSTEQGVSLLTELKSVEPSQRNVESFIEAKAEPPRLIREKRNESLSLGQKQPQINIERQNEQIEPPARKSDMLLKALNNIKEKNNSKKDDLQDMDTPKMGRSQTSAFPKYFAKTFEEEAKRDLVQKSSSNPSRDQNNDQEDSVESVTRMIREKLKNLQPDINS